MNTTANNIKGSAATNFIGGLLVLLISLFLLVKLATTGYYSNVADMQPSAVETRIQPIGRLTMGDGTPVGEREGKQVFDKVCIQCHGADKNVAFAPKVTHNDEWSARIAKGFDTLVSHAVNGFNDAGQMPARGGDSTLTDDEVARAVAYMANQSGGNFTAPAVQKGDAAASNAAAAASGSAGQSAADGEAVFNNLCVACHAANSAFPNAPRITRNDDWAPRLKQGRAALVQHAIQGFNTMPPRGGGANLSDADVEAAVEYMVKQSGGKL